MKLKEISIAMVAVAMLCTVACEKKAENENVTPSTTVSNTYVPSNTIDPLATEIERVSEYKTDKYIFAVDYKKSKSKIQRACISASKLDGTLITSCYFYDVHEPSCEQFTAVRLKGGGYIVLFENELEHGLYNAVYAVYFDGTVMQHAEFTYCDEHDYLCLDELFELDWDKKADDKFTLTPVGLEPQSFTVDKKSYKKASGKDFAEFDKTKDHRPYIEELVFKGLDKKTAKLHMQAVLSFGENDAGIFAKADLAFAFDRETCAYTLSEIAYN